MRTTKDTLHEKRKAAEEHIRLLEREGKQGVRYTAMMPDLPFLVLGLLSDIGWIIHLIAGIVYFCRNGWHHVTDGIALLALADVLSGVACLMYLNKIGDWLLGCIPLQAADTGMFNRAYYLSGAYGLWRPVLTVGLGAIGIHFALLLAGRTRYPRWMLAFHPVTWNLLLVVIPDIAQALQVPAATWMSVMSQSSTNSSIVVRCIAAAIYEKKHL